MREHRLSNTASAPSQVLPTRTESYEYLTLTVEPRDHVADARARVREHAEYGKWELMRSVLLYGGARRYVMRRRIIRVHRTL